VYLGALPPMGSNMDTADAADAPEKRTLTRASAPATGLRRLDLGRRGQGISESDLPRCK